MQDAFQTTHAAVMEIGGDHADVLAAIEKTKKKIHAHITNYAPDEEKEPEIFNNWESMTKKERRKRDS